MRGIEAISPAKSEECLDISEIATTITAVIKILIKIYVISCSFHELMKKANFLTREFC